MFIVAVVLLFVDWPILDPILSIGFTLFILFNVAKNIIVTVRLFLQATPDKDMQHKIFEELSTLEAVKEIHHLHLWSLDGERHVLTAHLVLDRVVDQEKQADLKTEIAKRLDSFHLEHTTVEIEFFNEPCRDKANTEQT